MPSGHAMAALISATELAALAGDVRVVVVDCRHDLARPEAGEAAWRDAHIPGALFMHLDRDLSAPKTGRNGRHPLPLAGAFAALLGALGISPQHRVVAYDDAGGMFAARLWWMLRWIGHADAAVLDGGLTAWRAAGGALDTTVRVRCRRRFIRCVRTCRWSMPTPSLKISTVPACC
jgi:thiosulfate/3-mercaptopyruvate sulfurtransferase